MNLLEQELHRRNLPELMRQNRKEQVKTPEQWQKRRQEIGEILSREFAGFPTRLSFQAEKEILRKESDSCGGKAETLYYELKIQSAFSAASIPFTLTVPKKEAQVPIFFYLAFTPEVADGIGEEVIDHGYAIANVFYQDIAADYFDGHMTGLGRFCTRNPYDSWGKLRIWAWCMSRIRDVLSDDTRLDLEQAAVMGHSRLGKAALLAGAFDLRFSLTVSCQSGAGGAALFRGKTGEQIGDLYGKGSRLWFAGNFFQYRDAIEKLPFDAHFLLSMMAGRHLYVTSASRDEWADPKSEFLGCLAASPAFECAGGSGLYQQERYLRPGECSHEGDIGYFLRQGTHYLSRDDWKHVFEYRKLHCV